MFLVFDIGGTKSRFATSIDGKELSNIKIIDTPPEFESGLTEFRNYYDLINKPKITSVAGGIAGPLNQHKSMVINAPNIPRWNNKPLKEHLQNIFNSQVFIENDAATVGLGEAIRGAGRGKNIIMYMTISTGVGGARILNGKIDESFMGFEPGHQLLVLKDEKIMHLESLISGSALQEKYEKNPQDIDDEKIWDEVTHYLVIGIHNSILHWSPEIVILGGSIVNKISLENIKLGLKEIMQIFPTLPEIKKTELEEKAGLYGALALVNKNPVA